MRLQRFISKNRGHPFLFPDISRRSIITGDYTRMNTYLVNRYCIPLDLNPNVTNPGIAEIPYENVQQVLDLLHHFLSVPPEAAQDLKVFPLEELLAALEQYVEEFLAVPNKYIS